MVRSHPIGPQDAVLDVVETHLVPRDGVRHLVEEIEPLEIRAGDAHLGVCVHDGEVVDVDEEGDLLGVRQVGHLGLLELTHRLLEADVGGVLADPEVVHQPLVVRMPPLDLAPHAPAQLERGQGEIHAIRPDPPAVELQGRGVALQAVEEELVPEGVLVHNMVEHIGAEQHLRHLAPLVAVFQSKLEDEAVDELRPQEALVIRLEAVRPVPDVQLLDQQVVHVHIGQALLPHAQDLLVTGEAHLHRLGGVGGHY
mmetsp:Transcript_20658/g.65374  ORF Transcript_20658/g.65374 Transcript_20658/m.65374 type:complete len:254 (-) Transcript_20658:539-1300(-)